MTNERLHARILQLEQERDAFIQQANESVAAYNGALAEVRRLLQPPTDAPGSAGDVVVVQEPAPAPTSPSPARPARGRRGKTTSSR